MIVKLIPVFILGILIIVVVSFSQDGFENETDIREPVKNEPIKEEEKKVVIANDSPPLPIVQKEDLVPSEKIDPETKVEEPPAEKPVEVFDREGKTSTRASNPIYTGFKERAAEISEKDEYFLGEYLNKKFPRNQPDPIFSKHPDDRIDWKLNLNASVCGKVILSDGHIYFVCYDTQVFKVNAKTGKLVKKTRIWYQPIGNPVEYGDTIIFPQRNGNITAIRKNDLKVVYNSRSAVTKQPGEIDISISGIVLNRDLIYVSKHWGNIYIKDAATGDMLEDPGVPYESRINIPAVAWGTNKFIYSNIAGEVLCFSKDGTKRFWKDEIKEGYLLSSMIKGDRLFYTTTEKKLGCYDLKGQKTEWEIELKGYGFNSIKVFEGDLVVSAGSLYRIKMDGKIIWELESKKTFGFSRGAPSINSDKDNIFAAEHEGKLYSIDLKSGKIIESLEMSGEIWNHLENSSGQVFVSNNQRELVSVTF